jgi:NADH-quinone oxidoreductase subunit N
MLGAILLLMVGLTTKSKWIIQFIYGVTLILAFYFNFLGFELSEILSKSLLLTSTAQNFTPIFLISGLIILLYKREGEHATEFYFFILSIITGAILIMKANSFLVTYLAIELTSFSAYILTNFSFKKEGYEAGIKYLLFGAISSAIMLFGFGLVYGTLNTFFISDWINTQPDMLFTIGVVFIVFGLLFKSSIIPFHIWVPAAYQSAPNDAVAIFSVVPKLGALVLLGRIIESVSSSGYNWIMGFCLILGVLTIVFGTLSALRQSNARRMISFGAIAHSGFLLPLAILNSETSNEFFWWYAAVYAIMNLAIFYLIDEFERNDIVDLKDYSNLGERNSFLAVCITAVLLSLIGIPPLAGFTAKFFLFNVLWEYYLISQDGLFMTYLIVALLATIISLFFYLRVPYYLFLVKSDPAKSIETSFSTKIIATLFSIVLLLLFFAPQILSVMQQLLNSNIVNE